MLATRRHVMRLISGMLSRTDLATRTCAIQRIASPADYEERFFLARHSRNYSHLLRDGLENACLNESGIPTATVSRLGRNTPIWRALARTRTSWAIAT